LLDFCQIDTPNKKCFFVPKKRNGEGAIFSTKQAQNGTTIQGTRSFHHFEPISLMVYNSYEQVKIRVFWETHI